MNAAALAVGNGAGAVPSPDEIPGPDATPAGAVVAVEEWCDSRERTDTPLNPSSLGEGAGPLDRATLAGADFQGGPASIRDPHAGVIFLNPLPPSRPVAAQRTGRWSPPPSLRRPSARELLDNPTTQNLRAALIGAGLFSTLTSLSFGFPGIGAICVGLTAFGLVISKPAKSRAAASPRLVQSSGTHSPVSPTCRANAAFSSRPQIGSALAKVSAVMRFFRGIPSLHLQRPKNGAGVVGDARQVGVNERQIVVPEMFGV